MGPRSTRGRGRGPVRWRWAPAVVALAVALGLLAPRPARAEWEDTRRVVAGSAHTFERGTFSLGIFAPLQYGALDSVMLSTHPVLDLLLTPNVGIRVRVYDGPAVVSLQLDYQQTFLGERDGHFPGALANLALVSIPLGWRVGLSVFGGHAWRIGEDVSEVPFGGTLHVLISPSDLLQLQVLAGWASSGEGWQRPSGQLLYAHAWTRMHLGVGVAVGRFAFVPWEDQRLEVSGVPVFPVVDAWWEF